MFRARSLISLSRLIGAPARAAPHIKAAAASPFTESPAHWCVPRPTIQFGLSDRTVLFGVGKCYRMLQILHGELTKPWSGLGRLGGQWGRVRTFSVSSSMLDGDTGSPNFRGTVVRWTERGFGFIRPEDGSPDVFCHFSSITDGSILTEDSEVSFDLNYDERSGRYRAENVTGGTDPSPSKVMFIHNIPFSIDKEFDPENYIGTFFDGVKHVRLLRDFDGRLKGYGFVEFESTDACESAMHGPDVMIDGRTIRKQYQSKDRYGGKGKNSAESDEEPHSDDNNPY